MVSQFWRLQPKIKVSAGPCSLWRVSEESFLASSYFLFFFFSCLFAPSTAAPSACGDSQAWGLIGAVASRATATRDPSHICNLHHSSWQHQILNPLSKAGDRSCILMDAVWAHYCWATIELQKEMSIHILLVLAPNMHHSANTSRPCKVRKVLSLVTSH